MIVIAIIGILAAIAIPQYQSFIVQAQVSEAFSLIDGIKTGMIQSIDSGTCAVNGLYGIPAAVDIKGKYVNTVTLSGGPVDTTPPVTGKFISTNCGAEVNFLSTAPVTSALRGINLDFALMQTVGSYRLACMKINSTIPNTNGGHYSFSFGGASLNQYLPNTCE
jgi:Tfp pilus assembly major pilin PilA